VKYEIRKYGDPVLRESGFDITEVDETIRALADDMLETMYAARGIGLAAQQVGETGRICVIDIPPESDLGPEGERENPGVGMPLVLINPRTTQVSEDRSSADEGCLSFPEITVSVTRPEEADVEFLDRSGEVVRLHVRGLLARAVQHEMDHLEGILFIDHASPVKKIALKGRLKRMRRETEEQLSRV